MRSVVWGAVTRMSGVVELALALAGAGVDINLSEDAIEAAIRRASRERRGYPTVR